MYLTSNITAIVLIIISLTVVSISTVTGRLYAIEQSHAIEGIDEEKCNEIYNCKIITKDVFKYSDIVDPFNKNQQINQTLASNLDDNNNVEKQSCERLMDVDIIKKKDQTIGEQNPKYMICLP